jgi:hypothetical protein
MLHTTKTALQRVQLLFFPPGFPIRSIYHCNTCGTNHSESHNREAETCPGIPPSRDEHVSVCYILFDLHCPGTGNPNTTYQLVKPCYLGPGGWILSQFISFIMLSSTAVRGCPSRCRLCTEQSCHACQDDKRRERPFGTEKIQCPAKWTGHKYNIAHPAIQHSVYADYSLRCHCTRDVEFTCLIV